jgi:hypothetical protein
VPRKKKRVLVLVGEKGKRGEELWCEVVPLSGKGTLASDSCLTPCVPGRQKRKGRAEAGRPGRAAETRGRAHPTPGPCPSWNWCSCQGRRAAPYPAILPSQIPNLLFPCRPPLS